MNFESSQSLLKPNVEAFDPLFNQRFEKRPAHVREQLSELTSLITFIGANHETHR